VQDATPRRPPRWLALVNPVNRFFLARGLGPGPQRLLTVTGRRSGQPRTTPVAVVEVAGQRYLVAGFEVSDWVHNARAAGRGTLRRGRTIEAVRLRELPVAARAPILAAFVKQVPGGRTFLTVAPNAPTSDFEDAAVRHPVFAVYPA
jgi:deazaflavin-dependent oxidoreductase (nitroreductase family)